MQLSEFEKDKLLAALLENQLPTVNEEVSVCSQASTKNKEFEKKWNKSLTSAQFKNTAIQHLDSLPWK
ncbi:hypothetical protein [Pedobacter rhodius]|uniref:Addiction module component n=1 Tax=Pedobacter rhodius TaxID=3004098 RepID=A0ABT4KWB5_9SPHI|nr:hypothetical protein [Pedobacter sp. SJ11]MCZ4223218.1 hypothetical protein [Pedobacter sp. SJ11]